MIKKIQSCQWVMVLVILSFLFVLSTDISNAETVASGSCGTSVTWTLDDAGLLTIRGTGAMTDYNYNNDKRPYKSYKNHIYNISIEEGVTSIGNYAFAECSNVSGVEISDSVTSIGFRAFDNCTNLTSIEIPDSVTDIGICAFVECTNLSKITLSKNLKSLSGQLFYSCSSINNIEIPSSVKKIEEQAFYECSALTNIVIPDGVEEIEAGAFENCNSLTSITIPRSVFSITGNIAPRCSSLTSVNVNENNGNYVSIDGILYTKDKTIILSCPTKKTTAALPDELRTIKEGAFAGCSALTEITIPDGVEEIEDDAFDGCSALTEIVIPDGVEVIGCCAFQDCSSITSIIIPAGVTALQQGAIRGCSKLKTVTLPGGISFIGFEVFYDCPKLSDVYYGGDENDWQSIEIENENPNLISATIHFNQCKKGHTLNNIPATDPKCTQNGNSEYWVCSVCGKYFSDNKGTTEIEENSWIIPASHTLTEYPATEPDCERSGNSKYYSCSVCNKHFSDSDCSNEIEADSWIIAKTGHKYSTWETTKAATELGAGEQTRTCSACGKTEKKTIAQKKPTLPAVAITAPSSTAKKTATVKWKKISAANQKKIASIQIQYSLDKTFKKGVKTTTAKKTAVSQKITKLTSKKTYYVRIRSYKKDKKGVHVSKWSAVKAVKVK